MYDVNNLEVIYLYDYALKGCTQKFPSYDDALKFIASTCYYNVWDKRLVSDYLDLLNITGNDTVVYTSPFSGINDAYLRRYVFLKEDESVVDVRNDIEIIKYYYENQIIDYKVCWKEKRKHSRWRRFDYTPKAEYRRDPIPYISSKHSHYGRNCNIMNEMRRNADPEMKEFVRSKRNVKKLSNILWDADWRSRERSHSWKDCSHRRHQYKDKK